ncbi:MAG: hypothetical protein LRY73_08655 [Bacillus sp. (in: Bacteria)]|nr:hypothetical protein [Bacillus sp. (in: firmicutes)]
MSKEWESWTARIISERKFCRSESSGSNAHLAGVVLNKCSTVTSTFKKGKWRTT